MPSNIKTLETKTETIPWVKWFEDRLGWTEFDHDKELSKGWKYTQVPYYKTVIGSAYAWCAMSLNTALETNRYKGTMSAGASSFKSIGKKCEFKKGAILQLRHASGRNHVTIFMGWKSEKKQLAYCLGGNQGNSINVTVYDISGNANKKDEVIGGPRWPILKS